MGKKKKILKRVNPEKSNKMIYAVAVGLCMIFGGFIYLSVSSNPMEKRMGIIQDECVRIKKSAGVIEASGTEASIDIVVDSSKHEDYKGLAIYSGKKLSTSFPGENIKVVVKDTLSKELYNLSFRNGRVLKSSQISSVPGS